MGVRSLVNERETRIQAFYAELGPALLAYARSILRDTAPAEDVLQQVFLKLLSNPALPLPTDARPYLFRAVRNTSLNVQRSTMRDAAHREGLELFTAPNGLSHLVPELEAALDDLPDEQRQVVILRIWGELTLDETAEVLGIPANTAASRYRYALAKLRQRLGALVRS
jgi:RNA polymerase sigma-70 factor (ECF subfamily)